MRRLRFRAAATLLLLLCGTPLYAQDLLPQAFLAAALQKRVSLTTNFSRAVLIAGCRPEATLRATQSVTLHIVRRGVESDQNPLPNTKDTVKLHPMEDA